MKQFFSFSFQHKVLLVFLLLINVPFLVTWYLAKNQTETMVLLEKEHKLATLCHVLDSALGQGGFDALLLDHDAQGLSREEKIMILNKALLQRTDEVGTAAPGLGVGYYSKELDAIISYGPSSSFHSAVGLSIPPDHPGRIVMQNNTPLVRSGTMVRGDILNAMLPIEREGKVIGYIWANELTTDITALLEDMSRNIFLVMALCFALTSGLLVLLSRRTVRNVDRIIKGVLDMRHDLTRRIPESDGELGEVAKNINAMAVDINNANEETQRAISVLQSVMSNVEALVYVCDPQTRILVYANEYLHKLLGCSELQGKPCYEALHGKNEPCSFCPQEHLFDENANPLFTAIHWENHNEIMQRDLLMTGRFVIWHDGRLLHMEVATDVTERNALAVAEAANLAQRDFLARMSHEIRTPMNGVLGMTHLAIQADPPPVQLEYLKKIQSSAALLLGIINDILDFSRIEAGKLTIDKHVFNLHEVVENTKELILPRTCEKNLELLVAVDASVPQFVYGDGLRLSQVLLNLLGNASKFTLEGYIALKMSAKELSSGMLRLDCEVRDSGIGMTAEQQKALFKPFSQADTSTSREFGGTGLGLSISKALVELMGGVITASSEPGKGSVFSFFIELELADLGLKQTNVENEAIFEAARYEGHTFLLVEDNEINQEIAIAVLSELGASADVTVNGEQGVKAFMEKDYSLILMDVRMPVMDGLEATRRIRASGKHDALTIPIIAMTANAMREDKEACADAGMDGHIAKPLNITELKRVLFHHMSSGKKADKE